MSNLDYGRTINYRNSLAWTVILIILGLALYAAVFGPPFGDDVETPTTTITEVSE